MKLYGVWFEGRYAAFDSWHKCCSRKLFKTKQEAKDYIPEYVDLMKTQCETLHQGFYTLDKDTDVKTKVIDFDLD
jgi:hypothetical protein